MIHSTIKIVLVGDTGVGKSALFERIFDNKFTSNNEYLSTIGVDYRTKNIIFTMDKNSGNLLNIVCRLQIWDTAGQERFRSITKNYYKGSHICIISFDTSIFTDTTLTSIMNWIQEVRQNNCPSNVPIYIIGTKIDKLIKPSTEKIINKESLDKITFIEKFITIYTYNDIVSQIYKATNLPNVFFFGMCSAKENLFIPHNKNNQIILSFGNMILLLLKEFHENNYNYNYYSNINDDNNEQLSKPDSCCLLI